MNKEDLRLWLWRKFGLATWRHALPFGADVYLDIHRLGFQPEIIFDVGANVGQKSLYMLKLWPCSFRFERDCGNFLGREILGAQLHE